MSAKHHRMLSIESEIRRSMMEDRFEVYYQPQVSIHEGKIVGVEALLRWNHPERGLLTPSYFLGVAEECGIILELGEWVMRTAVKEVQSWREMGVDVKRLAVNFTARQIEQPNFVDSVINLLKEFDFPGECFEIEITESTLMNDIENTVNKLKQLNNVGIHVAIDDFGTGYSSLSLLQRLPINSLKIDRSFIQDITDESDRSIIEAIAHMAKGLKLDMVAEGVEEEYQLNYLRQLDCPTVQGFYYSESLPANMLRELLHLEVEPGARLKHLA
jgi:EAL domain-containing protein (putative c-di-GMP-specific phosphodiesterase class I)